MDTVWIDRENAIEKALVNPQGQYIDAPEVLDAGTHLRLRLRNSRTNAVTVLDSATGGQEGFFSTDEVREIEGTEVRTIRLLLGEADLDEGQYEATLTLFHSQEPEGIVVGEFRITVKPS